MKVADTRASLILALKNDKNSARWEEFVNQYYDYLHYAAYQVDGETGRFRFVPDGVDPDEAVEQTFWQLKNIILPDVPQFDVDFTESQLEKKARHGLKWKIFELEKGKKFRNYLLSVLKNVARSLYNARKDDRLVFVENEKLEGGHGGPDDPAETADIQYEGCGEFEDLRQTWDDDIEAFERGEAEDPGLEESENESSSWASRAETGSCWRRAIRWTGSTSRASWGSTRSSGPSGTILTPASMPAAKTSRA